MKLSTECTVLRDSAEVLSDVRPSIDGNAAVLMGLLKTTKVNTKNLSYSNPLGKN